MTDRVPPRIAYLVNQYPKVSHSFIRREIQAVEAQGFAVLRIAIRGWDGELVDEEDLRERERTRYVLEQGIVPLALATLRAVFARPGRFLRALGHAIRLNRYSDRSLAVHLAYLAEACLIGSWVGKAGIRHVHAHFGTNPAAVAMLVRILTGSTFSFTVHGPEEFDKPGALHISEKIGEATFVVAVSSFGASQLYRWVPLEQWPKIRVVHCGLDEEFLREVMLNPAAEDRLVCVGRICEQKGQLLLVKAAAELARRNCPFTIVLAGDGEMRPAVEDTIQRSGLVGRVQVTGWLNSAQVRTEILASRALVLPSFAEGLPVVLMEAMALNRPVISTYVAGIPELVRHGESGWLVPAGDVMALADAMQEALRAPADKLSQMGRLGRERVVARHSATVEAGKLAACFHEALAPP